LNEAETRAALRLLGVSPDKGFGQNFLTNPFLASRIASALGPPDGTVLEIGPGLGALTGALAEKGHRVTALEISQAMSQYLRERLPGVTVVQRDFMKTSPEDLPGHPFHYVASNLPYSISTPALLRLCEPGFAGVSRAVLMLQKEVALRLECVSGGREYGRLALAVWPHFRVSVLFEAGPWEFFPRPEVESLVVLMERKTESPLKPGLYGLFLELVKASFSARRKKIVNNLARVYGKKRSSAILDGAGVDPDLRPERVAPESYARMAEEVGS
jgi:16S rRNA (adenine1518-N6/adenine1519-N6)-dimethyltransferase